MYSETIRNPRATPLGLMSTRSPGLWIYLQRACVSLSCPLDLVAFG